MIRKVFRLGVVEVGLGYVRYYNRTASGFVTLSLEQESRWRVWMQRMGAAALLFALAGCSTKVEYHPTLVCLPGVVSNMQAIVCVDGRVFEKDHGQGAKP